MSPHDSTLLQDQIEKLLQDGYIRPSCSPYVVSALLMPKKNEDFRMCVNSKAINNITIKHRFPILLIDDPLDDLYRAMPFLKLNLKSGYH